MRLSWVGLVALAALAGWSYRSHAATAGEPAQRADPASPGGARSRDRDGETAVAPLQVEPPQAILHGRLGAQQLVLTDVDAGGALRDVTRAAAFQSLNPEIAAVGPNGLVRPVGDGQTEIIAQCNGHQARMRVEVRQASVSPPVHFRNDIVPLLTKAGCNAGGCHGKASGQNGFKLTVFGFDPDYDYDALVKQARGRRVFPSAAERSLFLLKATGQIPHGGGRRMEAGSTAHELLTEWVRQGMPTGDPGAARVATLEVFPTERILAPEAQQQLLVTAVYSDGSRRDVTRDAEYSSNLEPLAEVNAAGLVTTGTIPGEVAIMVRYMGHVAVARILLPRPEKIEPYPELLENTFIDGLVWAKLRKLNILPSEGAGDAEFLRRAYLDTIGTLPTPEEARTFFADTRLDKRGRVIDQLLERPEFADYWALRWADVLRIDRQAIGAKGAYAFYRWLHDAIAADMPYSEMVRQIVVAQGNSGDVGPVNLYRAIEKPEDLTNSISQVFLGVRIECAHCHHHPYEKWGQEDFYGLAAYFARLQRKPAGRERDWIFVGTQGEIKHPRTGEVILPHPLDGQHWSTLGKGDGTGGQATSGTPTDSATRRLADSPTRLYEADPRHHLADWMTDAGNPWFSRVLANRLWAHFLGRGLVEPVDDLRVTNPASNEPLLDALAKHVVESGFDLKQVMRAILNSRVYQLSAQTNSTNETDEQNYSHARVKAMPAEVLLDAVCQATDVPEKFVGAPAGLRAIQLWDNRLPSYFLGLFGRPLRTSPCECERSSEPSIAQALHLMNSPEIQAKVSHREGRVARLLGGGAGDRELVEELYLATLSRPPDAQELETALGFFAQQPCNRRQVAEDLLWALLNSYEFVFNH